MHPSRARGSVRVPPVFKRPLVLLLPRRILRETVATLRTISAAALATAGLDRVLIYLGAVTHVFWDGFTHEDEWAFRDHPEMAAVMITVAGRDLHWVGLLQYGSSLLGLGLLAWWSWQWYRRARRAGACRLGVSPPGSPHDRWRHGPIRGGGGPFVRIEVRLQSSAAI